MKKIASEKNYRILKEAYEPHEKKMMGRISTAWWKCEAGQNNLRSIFREGSWLSKRAEVVPPEVFKAAAEGAEKLSQAVAAQADLNNAVINHIKSWLKENGY